MTGAGGASLAFRREDNGFLQSPSTTPDWTQPGVNCTLGDVTLENQQQRNRQPDQATPTGSKNQNIAGTMTVSFDLTDTNWHDLVFGANNSKLSAKGKQAPTAQWWISADLDGSTESRSIAGAAVVDATLNYNAGGNWRVELTIEFADEPDSISEPSTIVQPTEDQVFAHHGTTFEPTELGQQSLQSMSLSMPNLAHRREYQSRKARDFVVGAIEPSASIEALYEDNSAQQAAYGGTAPVDGDVDSVQDADVVLENANGTTITYRMHTLDPQSYSWNGLISAEENHTQSEEFHVADVEVL